MGKVQWETEDIHMQVNNVLNKQRLKRTLLTLQIQNFYIVIVIIGF